MTILNGKHILLGVTGSIAVYKAADLASKLTQQGAQVDVILTAAAEKFVTPLTFQSVSGRKAFTDADLWGGQAHILHVGLGHSADLLLIAPCTANTLARLAHGLADNLLTITALAMQGSILIAPAMDAGMYEHPATRENVRILRERGVLLILELPELAVGGGFLIVDVGRDNLKAANGGEVCGGGFTGKLDVELIDGNVTLRA